MGTGSSCGITNNHVSMLGTNWKTAVIVSDFRVSYVIQITRITRDC